MSAELESKVRAKLGDDVAFIEIVDEGGGGCDGGKFRATIVSRQFNGKSPLERQQLVNSALDMSRIHAFSMKCMTPEQWAKKQTTAAD